MELYFSKAQWKYLRIEAAFFLVFFCLFPILSGFEYRFIELHMSNVLPTELISNLYYGIFDVFTALVYYKIVQRYLFDRRYLSFTFATISYLIIYHFYRSGLYYLTAHFGLLPDNLQKEALRWYNVHSRVRFSTAYMGMQFLCIIALAYFIRSLKQDEQMKTLREQQLVSELNYLKAQLNPHFFFNTINNIYALALKQSSDTAPMVAKLGDMMRYILYETEHKTVSLSKEIDFLNNYIVVERIRHKHNRIQFDVQGISNNVIIEPLLLLPFIENAFKHGLEEETTAGFVTIVICLNEDELMLEVVNSKPFNQMSTVKGIGLQNVIKRLKILYPDRYLLEVNDEHGRYQVLLSLQL